MKYEELVKGWRDERARVARLGRPHAITSTRRFWKDQFHAYGWEVGFTMSLRFPDGQIGRTSFRDIGTDRCAAISNALRILDDDIIEMCHPAVRFLWDHVKALDAVRDPYIERISQWRRGWYKPIPSNSTTKLAAKFHAMRRAAVDVNRRPSRGLCTALAAQVTSGQVSYRDALARIVAAGGIEPRGAGQ